MANAREPHIVPCDVVLWSDLDTMRSLPNYLSGTLGMHSVCPNLMFSSNGQSDQSHACSTIATLPSNQCWWRSLHPMCWRCWWLQSRSYHLSFQSCQQCLMVIDGCSREIMNLSRPPVINLTCLRVHSGYSIAGSAAKGPTCIYIAISVVMCAFMYHGKPCCES